MVLESHSCDNNTPGVDQGPSGPALKAPLHCCQNNTSEVCWATSYSFTHRKQVGEHLSAGLQWEEEEVMQQKN